MRHLRTYLKGIFVVFSSVISFQTASAQGTAFTYQGQLSSGGSPANGIYDLRFAIYDSTNDPGVLIAGPVTNSPVTVSNGVFVATIDFGAGVFTGNALWLEIGVQTNGGSGFATLSPRQPITPVPYSMFANSASNLLGTLPAAQLSGTIPASQLPAEAVTNNQTNVTMSGAFTGTFNGDGSGLTNVSGTLAWKVIGSTSVQAAANTGYLLTNSSLVTVTLPTTANVGDVVRISGSGASGWKLKQNAGQSISGGNLLGSNGVSWSPHWTNLNWLAIASSADGNRLVALANSNYIYTSVDAGATWTARETNRVWSRGVASSADGNKLLAANNGGLLYTSTDAGATWTARGSTQNWFTAASSADGTRLVAAVNSGQIWTSTDSGVTWTAHASSQAWYAVASSPDGMKLVAAVSPGDVYTSTDSGTNWTACNVFGGFSSFTSVACSADGTRIFATAWNTDGVLYSSNSGTNWAATQQFGNERYFYSIACSTDGNKLVGANYGGHLWTSMNAGTNWVARDSVRNWYAVASSADGMKLAAGIYLGPGQIYTSAPISSPGTTSGTAGALLGGQNAAIELQYVGNGQWIPISSAGIIQAL